MFHYSIPSLWQDIQKGLFWLFLSFQVSASNKLIDCQNSKRDTLLHCKLSVNSFYDLNVSLAQDDFLEAKAFLNRCTDAIFSVFKGKLLAAEKCSDIPEIKGLIMDYSWAWLNSSVTVFLCKNQLLLSSIAAFSVNFYCHENEFSEKLSDPTEPSFPPTEGLLDTLGSDVSRYRMGVKNHNQDRVLREFDKSFEGIVQNNVRNEKTIASNQSYTAVNLIYNQANCDFNVTNWLKYTLILLGIKTHYELINDGCSRKEMLSRMNAYSSYSCFSVRLFAKIPEKGCIQRLKQSINADLRNSQKLREIFWDHRDSQEDDGGYLTISKRVSDHGNPYKSRGVFMACLDENNQSKGCFFLENKLNQAYLFMASLAQDDEVGKYLLGKRFDRHLSFVNSSSIDISVDDDLDSMSNDNLDNVNDVDLKNMEDVD